jgi:ADP-heptose:LPS heptosyltransferase
VSRQSDNQGFRDKIKNILLVRTDRIGDVILTLPVVDILKRDFPGSRIDFLVNKRISELIAGYPNINKVHSIEKDRVRDIVRICKKGDYDLAIVERPLFVIALALFLSGIKYRLGTGYRWYSFLFNLRHYQHRKHSVKHELQYNIDMLNALGITISEYPPPKLMVNDDTINTVKEKLIRRQIDIGKKFIIVHPSTLGSALTWSPANFLKMIQLLVNDNAFDANIILTGMESEKMEIIEIVTRLDLGRVHYIVDFDLKELAALIYLSELFISNSTGPIHIAAAVGTFVVGIYSPLIAQSPVRWAPYTDKKKVFTPKTPGGGNIPEHSGLMDSITPEEVYRFVKSYKP